MKKPHSRTVRQNRRITFESLENRQLLSGLPWLPWGWGFLPALVSPPVVGTGATAQAATTTTMAVSNTAPAYGQPVTLTATVSAESGTPFGTVQFLDGATVIGSALLRNGVATLQVGNLAVNAPGESHSLSAQFLANARFAGSTATAPVAVNVTQAKTVTNLMGLGRPVAPGQAATFFVQVGPDYASTGSGGNAVISPLAGLLGLLGRGSGRSLPPSGSVEFSAADTAGNVTPLGTAALNNGRAVFSTTALAAGTWTITAIYQGDANYAGSTSQSVTQVVGNTLSPARIMMFPSGRVVVNTASTLSFIVGPGWSSAATAAPTGTVSLYDATTGTSLTGDTPVSLAALPNSPKLSSGSFAATFSKTGLHLITVSYSGDGNYAPAQITVPVFVQSGSRGFGWTW